MSNELYHYRIKGMKWGVRRYQNTDGSLTERGKQRYRDDDIVVRKGETVEHISPNNNLKLKGNTPTYGYTNAYDAAVYRGRYAQYLTSQKNASQINAYHYNAKKDIVAPSAKRTEELFYEMYKKNPEMVKKGLRVEFNYQQSKGRIDKKYSYEDVCDDPSKLYGVFKKNINGYFLSMSLHDKRALSTEAYQASKEFVKELGNKKYNAMLDINDVGSFYGAKEPMIVINGQHYLKKMEIEKIPSDDILVYCGVIDRLGAANKQNPDDKLFD